jgi:hypothetical protein
MAGVFGALSVWSGLQLAVLLVFWTVLFLIWFIWTERDEVWRDKEFRTRLVSRLGLILVTTTLFVLPLILTLLSSWSEVAGDTSSIDESMYKQTDLAAYVTPSPYNPLWNDQINPVYDRFPYHRGFTPYIGLTVLVLIIAAAVGWRKKALFWLVSAGAWILLATGPVLRMNGDLYENIPLPYRWLREVFPISTIRASDRFNLLLVFTMAVLVGLGAAYLVRLRWGRWLLASASIFLVLEYLPIPIPMMELPQISGFIEEMADDDDVYVLIDYPLGYSNAKRWLYYQTIHGKPTVDGHVSRYSDGTYAYLASQPILNALYQGGEKPRYLSAGYMDGNGKPVVDLGPQIRALSEDGIRYALVHLPVTSYERLQHIKSILPFVFSFRDDSLLVYDLSRPLLHSYEPYSITVARGLELVQAVPRIKENGSRLSIELLVQMEDDSAQNTECRIDVGDSAVSAPFTLFADMSEWQEGDLTQVNVDLALPDHIQNGVYTWRLRCADGEPVIGNENLYVDDEDRGLFSQVLDLTYGDIIALDGYHKWYEGGDMHLTLQWRALSEIDQDYKVFIHVLDEDGGIAAQSDFVHCSGDCPSSQWLIDQRVRDEATLNLGGLPPGDYRLAVGLYNGDSGERLEVSRGDGSVVPDAYYVLDEKVITREKRPVWP